MNVPIGVEFWISFLYAAQSKLANLISKFSAVISLSSSSSPSDTSL